MLRVRVLGELQVELDGVLLTPPRRRPARALLGWLALHPGVHARSTVAGRLWPRVLDESARTSLRTSLSALRSVVGAEALVATREHVGLAEDVLVDAREFDRLVAAGRLAEALELCRGELLSGLDEDWILVERDQHRDRMAGVLGRLAADAADRGDHAAALSLARRRTALDPLDEPSHRELMRRLADTGDRGGALAVYERFAERLRHELGVAPSPATRSLAAELRDGARKPPPPVVPARVVAARRRGPLVGRDAELAALHSVWTRAAQRGRHLALVCGEPGIGKTRLVCEFAADLGRRGVRVLYGRAEEDALVPYQPLIEALQMPLGHDARPLPETSELSALLPDAAARLRLYEEVGAALDGAGAAMPMLLVLDDLHWADPATIRLLHHLAARPAGAPQLLLATYRDTEEHPFTQALAGFYRELPVERIELHGLGEEAVAALLGDDRSVETVRRLRERTGGNPFFIEQLLPGETIGIAETVSRRVSALGPEAHAVLDAAAVSGSEFELAVVAEVVGLPVDDTLTILDAAVRGRLILEVPDEPGRYAFVHAIVRDTLAGALTSARRARLHELFVSALEPRAQREPDRYLAALANHALEAAAGGGDPAQAADLAQQAARRAGAVLAHEDAAALLRRADAMLARRGASPERRAELRCMLGETMQWAGDSDEAARILTDAGELARRSGRPDLYARCALASGGASVTILGADAAFVAMLEDALDALGDADPALRARLLARLAIELAYDPDPGRREAAGSEALTLARRSDDPAALAAALSARHVTSWGPDGCEERLRLADEMLAVAERAGDRALALQARNWRVVDLFELGDGSAVRAEIDAYAERSAETQLPALAWYVPLWRATLAFLEGRIAEGFELSRRARELGRAAADANADVFFAENYLLRMTAQGRIADLDPGEGGVDGDVAERAERGPAWRAYRFTFAWWHAERGEHVRARRDFEDAIDGGLATLPRDVNYLAALASAAQACVLLRDVARARELRALLEPYATRMVITARGASHGGSVSYALARLAALCGDAAAADRLFGEATRRDERAGAPAYVARDLRAHGAWLASTGDAQRAQTLLRVAADTASEIGLDWPSEVAESDV